MPGTFQPVPDTVELTVQGTQSGQLVENKFYAKAAETITSVMVDALATIVADWVTTYLLPRVGATYTHTRVVARDLSADSSYEIINTDAAGGVGTASGTVYPPNVSFAVHRATGLSGKKAKSRIYWPAIPSSYAGSDGLMSSVAAAALVTALDQLRGNILANTDAVWEYGYPQRIINGVKLAVANFVPVTLHDWTDLFLDSQRRRLPGRGV
jgi:hypothetical protein